MAVLKCTAAFNKARIRHESPRWEDTQGTCRAPSAHESQDGVPATQIAAVGAPQQRLISSKHAYRQTCRRSLVVKADYTFSEKGEANSFDYRVFVEEKGKQISLWHDIPLEAGSGLYNMVVEIPKESAAKMEAATDEEKTPIKQDTKKGNLRFYPYNINWNYGMFPQTWEDPEHESPDVAGVKGDNDPVDVVEIGSEALKTGSVVAVKPLAVLAMIDDGELDWKVVAISSADPRADSVNDVEDVEREFPGELEKIRVWFRDYKKPDGKPENKFGFNDQPQNREYTIKVIRETHDLYNKLKSGKRQNTEELALA